MNLDDFVIGKSLKFTINWEAIDPNLVKIGLKDLEPKDRTISFAIKSKVNGIDTYATFTGCKFTSYNKPTIVDGKNPYVVTSISGYAKQSKPKKPRFTPAQRKAMR
jgi:hypothetical protein